MQRLKPIFFFLLFALTLNANIPTPHNNHTNITLDGSNSFDPNGTIVKYEWSENNQTLGVGAYYGTDSLPLGIHTITLKVTDDENNTATDSINVIVRSMLDTTPPLAIIDSPLPNDTNRGVTNRANRGVR